MPGIGTNTCHMASLCERFRLLCDTVARAAEETLPDGEARVQIREVVLRCRQVDDAGMEASVRGYFQHPPAHAAAVTSLDHTQFVAPLVLAGGVAFPMRDVLGAFCSLPAAYGAVWLAVLDVAEGTGMGCAAARSYIRQQIGSASSTPAATPPTAPPLHNVMGTILGAFPGLQECMDQITQGGGAAGAGGSEDVVGRVQDIILGPVLESIRASNPGAPDVGPAVAKIMEGFRSLNAVLMSGLEPTAGGIAE